MTVTAPAPLLCLDCGNSRLKWGLWSTQAGWLRQAALPLADLDSLADSLHQLLPDQKPGAALGCIVAGATRRARLEEMLHALGLPLRWNESCPAQCGVFNGYDTPERLGADRWAALIAARHWHPDSPCLVVNAGTATTIDHLDATGHFRGGIILPGIDLMRHALAQQTAQLPLASSDFQLLPRNTHTAIVSGCLQATAGAIERMFRPLAATPGACCLMSGGAADALVPLLDIPLRRVENLVLEGLVRIVLNADIDQAPPS